MIMYNIIGTLVQGRTMIIVKLKNIQTTKLRHEKVLVGMESK